MKIEDAKRIITNEKLYNINWYNEGDIREKQVGINKNNGEWIVYVSDERANVVSASIARFNSEEDALDVLIQKARYGKRYLL
jgi:hypothetical protein